MTWLCIYKLKAFTSSVYIFNPFISLVFTYCAICEASGRTYGFVRFPSRDPFSAARYCHGRCVGTAPNTFSIVRSYKKLCENLDRPRNLGEELEKGVDIDDMVGDRIYPILCPGVIIRLWHCQQVFYFRINPVPGIKMLNYDLLRE